jgi:nucleoside-diphosphate-sugar epimerase
MHILITGAAGMIGRKLTARLVAGDALNGRPIDRLTLLDVISPDRAKNFTGHVDAVAADIADPAAAGRQSPAGPT